VELICFALVVTNAVYLAGLLVLIVPFAKAPTGFAAVLVDAER
jgi:hypothetical protein